MSSILEYFGPVDVIKMQVLSKRIYTSILPSIVFDVPIPIATMLLERKRTEFYLCRWTDSRQLRHWPLLRIGEQIPGARI